MSIITFVLSPVFKYLVVIFYIILFASFFQVFFEFFVIDNSFLDEKGIVKVKKIPLKEMMRRFKEAEVKNPKQKLKDWEIEIKDGYVIAPNYRPVNHKGLIKLELTNKELDILHKMLKRMGENINNLSKRVEDAKKEKK